MTEQSFDERKLYKDDWETGSYVNECPQRKHERRIQDKGILNFTGNNKRIFTYNWLFLIENNWGDSVPPLNTVRYVFLGLYSQSERNFKQILSFRFIEGTTFHK
ncbi:hypothetical protein RF11_05804 [Thelohanellus kitauei]|uniref:Uncharacterized protein n=1 Tax=Thelohanellus kitauei TaxID=669202 RepID=A0A0C2IW58_THEKT|nr:hypothetical protein RF11_05804 [Thelohanellus kitauei]